MNNSSGRYFKTLASEHARLISKSTVLALRVVSNKVPQHPQKTKIAEANSRMLSAWHEGRELLDRLGERAGYRAMADASSENTSEAERIRKLRSIGLRMTEREVREICERCEKAQKAWGTQYLIVLCRLPTASERKKMVTLALKERLGLKELARSVRVRLAELGTPARHNRRGAGRRRKLDWSNSAEIADEIERMAISWVHLSDELQLAAMSRDLDNPLSLLPSHLRQEFQGIVELATKLIVTQ